MNRQWSNSIVPLVYGMFFYLVLTPISITSGLWSTGNTRKYQQIDVYIYQCVCGPETPERVILPTMKTSFHDGIHYLLRPNRCNTTLFGNNNLWSLNKCIGLSSPLTVSNFTENLIGLQRPGSIPILEMARKYRYVWHKHIKMLLTCQRNNCLNSLVIQTSKYALLRNCFCCLCTIIFCSHCLELKVISLCSTSAFCRAQFKNTCWFQKAPFRI